ncbi:unnamed protein product [Cyprideis torosa]|uniref:Uncharacterized protein n=1 Tax=Cyprideis torosa TaxID=163714 RepID=A0A7R8WS88_9CRUS|nr:unnamed protein product [Cyprideis torosa]CAG0909266.1 unnamed protein product [Cyprideis torosa]
MSAGFDYARGNVMVTMDGDLQNDPRDIPSLLNTLKKGSDVVAGWRYDRKDPFISRRLPSIIANKLISTITGVHLHDYGCTLKAFKSEVANEIKLYGEMHRFIPAIASGIGISIAEEKVNHRPRLKGTLLFIMLLVQRQFYNSPIGLQFVMIGLFSELQVRTYHESQGKPTYYVKSISSKKNPATSEH